MKVLAPFFPPAARCPLSRGSRRLQFSLGPCVLRDGLLVHSRAVLFVLSDVGRSLQTHAFAPYLAQACWSVLQRSLGLVGSAICKHCDAAVALRAERLTLRHIHVPEAAKGTEDIHDGWPRAGGRDPGEQHRAVLPALPTPPTIHSLNGWWHLVTHCSFTFKPGCHVDI